MTKRDFLKLTDLSPTEAREVLTLARVLKDERRANPAKRTGLLAGRSIAVVLEKASTRTRVSFEVGTFELGGHAVFISQQGSQLGRGEPLEDTARVLSGYCHAIVFRTFGQDRIAEMTRAASVPVVNALTDQHHPCQVATDLFTVREHFGRIDRLAYAWIGDGNNMAHSWIEAAGLFGLELRLACPDGFAPDTALVAAARDAGAKITLTTDPRAAAAGAHVISTDVWASMGQEDDAARRRAAFAGYCVDGALVQRGAEGAIVLHCLPAHRGEEITGDVLDGPRSLAWLQAENRLHVGKAILEHVIASG